MKLSLKILSFLLLLYVSVSAHDGRIVLNIDKPGFVPVDSSYQFALLLSSRIHQASKINFYLFLDNGVDVESVLYSTRDYQAVLKFQSVAYPGYYGKTVMAQFSDYDSTEFNRYNSQLIIDLRAKYIKQTEVAFAFEMMEGDSITESISSFDSENRNESLPIMDLSFYLPQKHAGNCLKMSNNSRFVFNENYSLDNNRLLFGFWAKLTSIDQRILNVISREYGDTLFSMSIGSNKGIIVPDGAEDIDLTNLFVSNHSWNYYSVLFDFNFNEIKVLLNGKQAFTIRKSFTPAELLSCEILNTSGSRMLIDNFGVYDFGNKLSRIKKNLNYVKVISDSSRQIYLQTFDNISDEELLSWNLQEYDSGELQTIESDAPIFTRLPELYVKSFENFNEVIWQNTDDKVVDYYVLEKSLDGIDYTEVGDRSSDADPEKEYSLLDHKNSKDEIVYYRVKVINKDESILYSPTLKMGQAQQENFLIEQNYPNPFNPLTTSTVEVLDTDEFSVIVYDLVGNKIITVYEGVLEEGIHKFDFDGSELPSGIYFLEVSSRSFTQAIKMILAK